MSMPCLHSASVPTTVPSTSTIASSKKSADCWGQSLDARTQLVMDLGGGDHGDFAFGSGLRGDAVEDSPSSSSQERARALFGLGALASGSRPRENNAHSKPSVAWKNVGLLLPA